MPKRQGTVSRKRQVEKRKVANAVTNIDCATPHQSEMVIETLEHPIELKKMPLSLYGFVKERITLEISFKLRFFEKPRFNIIYLKKRSYIFDEKKLCKFLGFNMIS